MQLLKHKTIPFGVWFSFICQMKETWQRSVDLNLYNFTNIPQLPTTSFCCNQPREFEILVKISSVPSWGLWFTAALRFLFLLLFFFLLLLLWSELFQLLSRKGRLSLKRKSIYEVKKRHLYATKNSPSIGGPNIPNKKPQKGSYHTQKIMACNLFSLIQTVYRRSIIIIII